MTKDNLISLISKYEKELGNKFDKSDKKYLSSLSDSTIQNQFIKTARNVIRKRLLCEFRELTNSDNLEENLYRIPRKANAINSFLFRLNLISMDKILLLLETNNLMDRLDNFYNSNDENCTFSNFFATLESEHSTYYGDVIIKSKSQRDTISSFTTSGNFSNIRDITEKRIIKETPKGESFYCFINYFSKNNITGEQKFYSNAAYLLSYEDGKLKFEKLPKEDY